MKYLNLNLNKTLSPNSNIVLSSQQAIKSYIDSKKVFIQFLQATAPTTFKTGDKWLNTDSNKLFTATTNTSWNGGEDLNTSAVYSFNNLLYHFDGISAKCYSTISITEQNANKEIKQWFGTLDEYNNLESKDENTHYIIIDDSSTSAAILATQEEFDKSVTDKAATPSQVNEKFGNYLPLAGGNLDAGAILRFTNTNNQVSSVSLDANKYITMSDNLKVGGDINTNSLVSTTGNIYKGSSSGATNIWSDSFATAEKAGIIKVGENLSISEDGTLNAEAGGGSGFDFEGTKEQFDAAVIAGTITDDSVSLITDDVSGDTVATKTDLAVVENSKANVNLNNIPENYDYIIERKLPTDDDQSWFEVYKSGWIRQGGLANSSSGDAAITLSKPYTDTNFTIIATNVQTADINAWGWVYTKSKTTTGFTVSSRSGSGQTTTCNTMWIAEGQGA
jgi:hypothetical protein